MAYQGKKRLYDFLKERGYKIPKMKEMWYTRFRGSEWLKYFGIELYSTEAGQISVTVIEETEDGEKIVKEYSTYRSGELVYQKKSGRVVVSQGKEVTE